MLSTTYYAQNYAGIICWGLPAGYADMGECLVDEVQHIKVLCDEDYSSFTSTSFTIQLLTHCKYLGVVLQSNLRRSEHIEQSQPHSWYDTLEH